MKRSEMLNIIWHSINELEDADHILKAIEKAGMLPPYNEKAEEKDFQLKSTTPKLTYFYKWEPENE